MLAPCALAGQSLLRHWLDQGRSGQEWSIGLVDPRFVGTGQQGFAARRL